MRRTLITAAALMALAATALGAVHVTSESRVVCIPPAIIQAWS